MATCNDIIALGLRMGRVIGFNETPSAAEADIGMTVLQSLYDGWFIGGEFGQFTQVYKADDYTVEEQDHVTAETGVAVTLPTTFNDSTGEYGDGTGSRRAPYELAAVAVEQDGSETRYVWEGSAWTTLSGKALTDTAPLTKYGEAGLAACFAARYADTFGAAIAPGVAQQARQFMSTMRSRRIAANPRGTAVYY